MKTRRSVRNQNILYNELFPPPPKPTPLPPATAEEIDAMWWLGKTSRNAMKRDLERTAHREAVKRARNHT